MIKLPYTMLKVIIVVNIFKEGITKEEFIIVIYRTDKNNTFYNKVHLIH